MSNLGIDYGRGVSNCDLKNGIRYGVISQGSVGGAWYESAEADYGEASCPKCGNALVDYDDDKHGVFGVFLPFRRGACDDYACESCELTCESQDAFGEEPQGWNYSGDGYTLTDCLDSDIFVLESPFYTFAQFCSPCVPGAGDLDNAMEDGVKTYCLGHDWFWDTEDKRAPYRVYSVETGEEVLPTA